MILLGFLFIFLFRNNNVIILLGFLFIIFLWFLFICFFRFLLIDNDGIRFLLGLSRFGFILLDRPFDRELGSSEFGGQHGIGVDVFVVVDGLVDRLGFFFGAVCLRNWSDFSFSDHSPFCEPRVMRLNFWDIFGSIIIRWDRLIVWGFSGSFLFFRIGIFNKILGESWGGNVIFGFLFFVNFRVGFSFGCGVFERIGIVFLGLIDCLFGENRSRSFKIGFVVGVINGGRLFFDISIVLFDLWLRRVVVRRSVVVSWCWLFFDLFLFGSTDRLNYDNFLFLKFYYSRPGVFPMVDDVVVVTIIGDSIGDILRSILGSLTSSIKRNILIGFFGDHFRGLFGEVFGLWDLWVFNWSLVGGRGIVGGILGNISFWVLVGRGSWFLRKRFTFGWYDLSFINPRNPAFRNCQILFDWVFGRGVFFPRICRDFSFEVIERIRIIVFFSISGIDSFRISFEGVERLDKCLLIRCFGGFDFWEEVVAQNGVEFGGSGFNRAISQLKLLEEIIEGGRDLRTRLTSRPFAVAKKIVDGGPNKSRGMALLLG